MPKRAGSTPRYLLKLQTEVDAMQQLGPSLDAVYLKVGTRVAAVTLILTLNLYNLAWTVAVRRQQAELISVPFLTTPSLFEWVEQCRCHSICSRPAKRSRHGGVCLPGLGPTVVRRMCSRTMKTFTW